MSPTVGLVVVVAILAVALVFGWWRRRTDGAIQSARPSGQRVLSGAQLGGKLGERATLVEFSSSFCAPCRATRQILDRVATDVDGVAVIEVDAENRLDVTRDLGILRTPTVLVLDDRGTVRFKAAGQPRYADVIGALGSVIPTVDDRSSGVE